MLYNDTIAAIATGMTSSGIGIIRISGSDAFAVAEKIFRPHKKDKDFLNRRLIPFTMERLWMGKKYWMR